jgi:acyl-CoA thioesterase
MMTPRSDITPEERARKSAEAMMNGDTASPFLGIQLDQIGPGEAEMSMIVKDQHLNGHGICHGGFIFTLADSCFAFACNSLNQKFVSQHGEMTYIAPGMPGDRLVATGHAVSQQGRSGIYDVVVRNQDGQDIAQFRGLCRSIKGTNFEE